MSTDLLNMDSIISGELLLFRTLWSSSSDNMFIVKRDDHGNFISELTNPSMKATLGLTAEQIDNTPLQSMMDSHSYEIVRNRYNACIEAGQTTSYEESHTIMGEISHWDTTIIPVVDTSNNVTRIFGVSRNITELKMLTEQLEDKVKERTFELSHALSEIEKISTTDKLTGLYNRHKLDQLLAKAQNQKDRYNHECTLAIIDLDHFKEINDHYGHITGDKVLAEFSELVAEQLNKNDILGRWGGEEFLMIMPETDLQSAQQRLHTIRLTIAAHNFKYISKLTASFGVTALEQGDKAESAISRADAALYWVKNHGRNNLAASEKNGSLLTRFKP